MKPHRPTVLRLSAGLLALAALFAPVHVQAQAPQPAAKVQLGIGGKLKVGNWTPVAVELAQPAGDQTSIVVVTTDYENNQVENLLTLESPTRAVGLVQPGRLDGRVTIVARTSAGDRTLGEIDLLPDGNANATSYRQNTEFWGVLGSSGQFAEAAALWTDSVREPGQTSLSAAVAFPLDWNSLPDRVEAWDSLDVIVVGGEALNAPPAKSELLRQWVERGGRLLLVLGSATPNYEQSPMARWSPIAVSGTVNATSLEMLNDRVRQSSKLTIGRGARRRSVAAARLQGPPDRSLPGPAVLSKPYGFGLMTAFAFDFEQPPLSTWESHPKLIQGLMMPSRSAMVRTTRDSDVRSTGITDLASQLASGLDQFQQVDRLSFRGVMVWTVLWMAVLFPLDYLLVHRLLKRPQLTWLTLPLLITAATLIAARSARAGNSIPLTLNQVDLLDYSAGDASTRVRSWMAFYSPETTRYDVKANSTLAGQARLAWNAKPEEGLRGLYRQGGINFGSPSFQASADHCELKNLPVRMWSSYSLTAEANIQQKESPLFDSSLTESDAGRLEGSIRHHFGESLRDWIVVYKNFVYHPVLKRGELQLGTWPADSPWRPGIDGQATLVKSYLQGRRDYIIKVPAAQAAAKDQVTGEITEYDPLEFDPQRLLRMLTFHEAADGAAYTGLSNSPLAKLDLSRTLGTVDCAIVVARVEGQQMSYELNGREVKPATTWTFLRAVLPVNPQAR